jgi:hypothetical protein
MGGWRWMDLDNNFRIRQVLSWGSVLLLGLLGLSFSWQKKSIIADKIYLHTSHSIV